MLEEDLRFTIVYEKFHCGSMTLSGKCEYSVGEPVKFDGFFVTHEANNFFPGSFFTIAGFVACQL